MLDQKILMQKLLYLYGLQTSEEKIAGQTVEKNGCGFNGIDANILTSFSEQIRNGRTLSQKQLILLEKLLPKYHNQFADNAWKLVVVPPTAVKETIEVAIRKNTLSLCPQTGGLVFTPISYPSKQIKSVAPFYWVGGAGGSWRQSTPLVNQSLVRKICELFGDVEVAPEVLEAIKTSVVALPPEIANHTVLFPFQKEAIHFSLTAKQNMLCLAPGLGKTVVAIMAAKAANCNRILVISPLSLLYNWMAEIQKWIGENAQVIHKQVPETMDGWIITNYDTVRLQPEKFASVWWDAIILDETIILKNRKAQRTRAIKNLVQKTKPKYLWLLSGAPTSRLYDDLWAQLNIIAPTRFSSYWRFAERYCYVLQSQWGWQITSNREDAAENIQADLQDIYFARTQDQVLDLPEWIFEDVCIPMSKVQSKMYADMESDFIALLENEEGENKLVAPNVLAQLTRLIQLASNPILVGGTNDSTKWEAAEEMLEFEELPAIIWTSFIQTAEILEKHLSKKYRVGILTGKTKSNARQSTVNEFQAGKLDVLIAHPGVGKFGFTLTAARTAIYLERNYNGDDYYQSLHRIRRIGTKFSPHVIHLQSTQIDGSPTVDYVISRVLEGRKNSVVALTTGELTQYFGGSHDSSKN